MSSINKEKEAINDLRGLIRDQIRKKETVNTKNTFEKVAKSIVKAYKCDLNNFFYHAFSDEISKIFRNETKGKTQMFMEDNLNYILIAFPIVSMVLSIILKFV